MNSNETQCWSWRFLSVHSFCLLSVLRQRLSRRVSGWPKNHVVLCGSEIPQRFHIYIFIYLYITPSDAVSGGASAVMCYQRRHAELRGTSSSASSGERKREMSWISNERFCRGWKKKKETDDLHSSLKWWDGFLQPDVWGGRHFAVFVLSVFGSRTSDSPTELSFVIFFPLLKIKGHWNTAQLQRSSPDMGTLRRGSRTNPVKMSN